MTTALHHRSLATAQAASSAEPMELLRNMLEERYTADTARLTQLTVRAALPGHSGRDSRVLQVQAAAVRHRIAETAHALKRMSEGIYGICADCQRPIPIGRLRATPEATYCVPCRRLRSY